MMFYKRTARKVFDVALKPELQQVMQEAKKIAHQIKEPADVCKLERYLTQRRRDIDRKYDSPSSRLTRVFGALLCERRPKPASISVNNDDRAGHQQ